MWINNADLHGRRRVGIINFGIVPVPHILVHATCSYTIVCDRNIKHGECSCVPYYIACNYLYTMGVIWLNGKRGMCVAYMGNSYYERTCILLSAISTLSTVYVGTVHV